VPLSEDEERILNEIERGFYRHDPRSAKRNSGTTLPRYLARNCRWALLGFIGGLIILLVSFASSWILGLVGFGVMTAMAIVFVQNMRRMGRHGWQQLTSNLDRRGFAERYGETTKRLRRRLGDDK
jgi:predicted outer membrane lipoprotein